jgi:hypothetical protein
VTKQSNSPPDPAAGWIGTRGGWALFAYSNNCLIGPDNAHGCHSLDETGGPITFAVRALTHADQYWPCQTRRAHSLAFPFDFESAK